MHRMPRWRKRSSRWLTASDSKWSPKASSRKTRSLSSPRTAATKCRVFYWAARARRTRSPPSRASTRRNASTCRTAPYCTDRAQRFRLLDAFYPRPAYYAPPLRELLRGELAELCRRRHDNLHTFLGETLPHLIDGQALHHLAIEALHDV